MFVSFSSIFEVGPIVNILKTNRMTITTARPLLLLVYMYEQIVISASVIKY